jgi:hypothetical protein
MVFTGNIHPEEFICTCTKPGADDCQIHGKLKLIKATRGKRTSEGYKPEKDEKVEVRGD